MQIPTLIAQKDSHKIVEPVSINFYTIALIKHTALHKFYMIISIKIEQSKMRKWKKLCGQNVDFGIVSKIHLFLF